MAVITMVQSHGFPIAWTSLRSLSSQLSDSRNRFVLFNDEPSSVIEDELARLPFTTVICPGENLGVAMGRNELIRAAVGSGADIIVSIDDDLLFPSDYLDSLEARFRQLTSEYGKVGIVGPVVLDFEPLANILLTEDEVRSVGVGDPVSLSPMAELRRCLIDAWGSELPETAVYHAGIRNWVGNYLRLNGTRAGSARRLFDDALEGPRLPNTPRYELKRDPQVRNAVLDSAASPVPTDTLPGGVCMYTAALIDEIGAMDPAFSPFGFEDSDFAIRSIRAGYKNFVLPEIVAVHDIAHRGRERSASDRLFIESRSRALLARKHASTVHPGRVAVELAVLSPLRIWDVVSKNHTPRADAVDVFVAGFGSYLAGWLSGTTVDSRGTAPLIAVGWNEVRQPVALQAWRDTPSQGLPIDIRGIATVALNWDPVGGILDVGRLEWDIPGLGIVSGGCRVVGIEGGSELTMSSFDSAQLATLWLDVKDGGAMRRLEETIAWRRRERTDGYLEFFAQSLSGRRGSLVRRFLASAFRESARLQISIEPVRPVTFSELWSLTSESLASEGPPVFELAVRLGESDQDGGLRSEERGNRWMRST